MTNRFAGGNGGFDGSKGGSRLSTDSLFPHGGSAALLPRETDRQQFTGGAE